MLLLDSSKSAAAFFNPQNSFLSENSLTLVVVSFASLLLRFGKLAGVVNLAVMTLESNGVTDCFPVNTHTPCFPMETEIRLVKNYYILIFIFCFVGSR